MKVARKGSALRRKGRSWRGKGARFDARDEAGAGGGALRRKGRSWRGRGRASTEGTKLAREGGALRRKGRSWRGKGERFAGRDEAGAERGSASPEGTKLARKGGAFRRKGGSWRGKGARFAGRDGTKPAREGSALRGKGRSWRGKGARFAGRDEAGAGRGWASPEGGIVRCGPASPRAAGQFDGGRAPRRGNAGGEGGRVAPGHDGAPVRRQRDPFRRDGGSLPLAGDREHGATCFHARRANRARPRTTRASRACGGGGTSGVEENTRAQRAWFCVDPESGRSMARWLRNAVISWTPRRERR